MSVISIEEAAGQFNGDFRTDLLSAEQISPSDLTRLMDETEAALEVFNKLGKISVLEGHMYSLLFWDSPSTRTKESFKRAITRLGADYHDFDQSSSSEEKGETFEDTVETLDAMLHPERDGLIIRNKVVGSVKRAAEIANADVTNCGDGIGEHPTQGILDTCTVNECLQQLIREGKIGNIQDVFFAFEGDGARARTTNSTALLLAKLGVKRMAFVAPVEEMNFPRITIEKVRAAGVEVVETDDLREVLPELHFIYGLRTQFEAMTGSKDENRQRLGKKAFIPAEWLTGYDVKLMHPGPEDSLDLTFDPLLRQSPNSLISRQVTMGMASRMAWLALNAGKSIREKLREMPDRTDTPLSVPLAAAL